MKRNIVNSKGEVHSFSYKDDSGYGVYYTINCGIAAVNFGSRISWTETNKKNKL